MAAELVPRVFDAACLPELAAFDCGTDPFGRIATEWIRCIHPNDSAIQAIAERQTEVLLYTTPAGQLVGFGSLGKTQRTIKNRVKETWSIIPHVGIDFRFRGQPANVPWHERYAASIMIDLMAIARDHNTPTLMLKVHKDNQPAIKLYERLGFVSITNPNTDGYRTMTIENAG